MKSAEIKDISTKDLQERIETEKAQLAKLKVQHAVSPVENPSIIKKNRRDIARMLTILRQKNAKYATTMERNLRKERIGVVVSNKMEKTIVVAVARKVKHPIYGKFVNKTTKFVAESLDETCKEGDTVRIMETRPLSKTKRWRLVQIIERAK